MRTAWACTYSLLIQDREADKCPIGPVLLETTSLRYLRTTYMRTYLCLCVPSLRRQRLGTKCAISLHLTPTLAVFAGACRRSFLHNFIWQGLASQVAPSNTKEEPKEPAWHHNGYHQGLPWMSIAPQYPPSIWTIGTSVAQGMACFAALVEP